MSEEKRLGEFELEDDALENISGGRKVSFTCIDCGKTVWGDYVITNNPHARAKGIGGGVFVTCECQAEYTVIPNSTTKGGTVTKKGTFNSATNIVWDCQP